MDRVTFTIAGAVLLLVSLGLGAAAFVDRRQQAPDLTTPGGVVLAYALAEQRGDTAAAWDLLAPSAQARTTRDHFLSRAGREADRGYLSTENVQVDADGASVALVRTYPSTGGMLASNSNSQRSTVRLARGADGWRITVPPDDYVLTLPRS